MVAGGLERVRSRLARAEERAGRAQDDVTLVAVSKGRSVDEIMAAYAAGQRDFGENRAQELAAKVPQLPDDIRWHFVGSLQSRKATPVGRVVRLLHSMDRMSLARKWLQVEPHPPPCLLQVNIAHEPQKHGVDPGEVNATLEAMESLDLRPIGLMVIPPVPQRPEDSRNWFASTRALRDSLSSRPGLVQLSMGMTDDFEVAVEEGATIIRVGRAIFETPT